MAAGVVFSTPLLAHQLRKWDLLPHPEQVTELFFTDYRKLPATLQPGASSKVSFVIHNLEHQAIEYAYAITATNAGQTPHTLDQGTLALQHDQSQTIEKTLTIPKQFSHAQVTVTLTYPSQHSSLKTQSIHYWVTVVEPKEKEQ